MLSVAAKCDALCRCMEENKKVELTRQHTARDEEGYKDFLIELEKGLRRQSTCQSEFYKVFEVN